MTAIEHLPVTNDSIGKGVIHRDTQREGLITSFGGGYVGVWFLDTENHERESIPARNLIWT